MTASTLTHLPLAAGGAAMAGLGRAGLWAIARYMRAPLANTGMLVLATMTAMAGTNALYNQTTMHPAPMFAPSPVAPIPAERPDDIAVLPAGQPATSAVPALQAPAVETVTGETTGSLPAAAPPIPDAPVGNTEVFEVQKKLLELNLFEGEVDGYYGPMTARAIRAFEERNGLTPQGALTPAIVEAILKADVSGRMQRQPVTQAPPAAPVAQVEIAPQTTAAAPTPAPAPDILIGPVGSARANPIDTVVASATETIDSIISAIDNRGTPAAPAQRPVPALPLLSSPATATQAMPPAIAPAETRTSTAVASVQQAPAAPARSETQQASAPPAATTNTELVSQVQRGLASLGFLHGAIDGQANEATARAIRNFEVYHNYKVTGEVSPALVDMLVAAGASI